MDLLPILVSVVWLLVDGAFCYQVTGVVTMENTTDLQSHVTAGDTVFFSFSVNLDQLATNGRVLITIAGDSLERTPYNPDAYPLGYVYPGLRTVELIHRCIYRTTFNLSPNTGYLISLELAHLKRVTNLMDVMTYRVLYLHISQQDILKTYVLFWFNNDTHIDAVTWTLSSTMGNKTYTRKTLELDTREEFYEPFSSQDKSLGYLLNITSGLDPGSWYFDGSFKMSIIGDVTGGSLIRSVMTVTVVRSNQDVTMDTVASNYYVVQMPEVMTKALSPLTQPILGLFTAQISVNSPRVLRNCIVQVFTSPESTSNEVRLTVQKLSVSINDTSGTTADAMNDLRAVSPEKSSSLGSYQNNVAFMDLPRMPLDGNYSEVKVASDFTVRVEDYSELQSGDVWPVYLGVSFSGNLMWVGSIDVNISAPVIRLPDLDVDVKQLKQCAYDGNSTAVLKVLVKHSTASTGTAYNVTVNLYLTGYMTMSRNVYTQPLENTIEVVQDQQVVVARIARLTFSDPFSLEVTLNLDLTDLKNLMAANRVVTAEAVYGDRWGNVTDILSNTSYVSINVSSTCSQRLTWANSSTCPCDHYPSLSTCGCCVANSTQCGAVRPHACAPATERWRCVSYKEGFEAIQSIPKSALTESIRCDSFYMRRGSATGVSCHKILPRTPVTYLELSPRVAVVTGINSASGVLYGISNNGLAYVTSEDGGASWTSIRDAVYTKEMSDPQIIRSTSI